MGYRGGGGGGVSLVMGMDQHRAQISAEWIDTVTGEIFRARVAPADRAGVRKFLAQFKGAALEVALEATTGWRFVVEELQRVGAEVHLAEPAETSALKGRKKRAKTDWADARNLRELLLIGRRISPSTSPMSTARPGISPGKDRPRCAGRYTKQRKSPGRARAAPTASITSKPSSGSAGTARASRSHASCSNARTTSCVNSAIRPWSRSPAKARPTVLAASPRSTG
jgi:hypothetical protein